MTRTLVFRRSRFARKWFAPLIFLFVLASALALANDGSGSLANERLWPSLDGYSLQQGRQGEWQRWSRRLQDFQADFWCLDRDSDRMCEEWRYRDTSGIQDDCQDPNEDQVCNYRRKTYPDRSFIEWVDRYGNGFHEYVHVYNARGADHQQSNNNDNSRCNLWPGETLFLEPYVDAQAFNHCLTHETNSYFLPGEVAFVQYYQASPLVVRWFDNGVFIEQAWDSNGDGTLDSYCQPQGTACVTITPVGARGKVSAMETRRDEWYKRWLEVNDAADPLIQQYVLVQYHRSLSVFDLIRTLAYQSY